MLGNYRLRCMDALSGAATLSFSVSMGVNIARESILLLYHSKGKNFAPLGANSSLAERTNFGRVLSTG